MLSFVGLQVSMSLRGECSHQLDVVLESAISLGTKPEHENFVSRSDSVLPHGFVELEIRQLALKTLWSESLLPVSVELSLSPDKDVGGNALGFFLK